LEGAFYFVEKARYLRAQKAGHGHGRGVVWRAVGRALCGPNRRSGEGNQENARAPWARVDGGTGATRGQNCSVSCRGRLRGKKPFFRQAA